MKVKIFYRIFSYFNSLVFRFRESKRREVLLFLLPLSVVILVFILIPVIGTFRDSLYLDVTFLGESFVGFENYRTLIADPAFHQSILFTLMFVFVSAPLELLLGLIVALFVNESIPGRGMMRAAILVPWAIPATVSGKIFQLIYDYNYGAARYLIEKAGYSGAPINWLGTPVSAFISLIAADAWKTTPFIAIIILAGLSAIPLTLYDQAKIDRAGSVRRFYSVTLPLIGPVLVVAILFRSIEALRVFDVIFVLTGGGPGGSTTSLSMLGFNYFSGGDFGYGSTISVILFVLALGLSLAYVKLSTYGGSR